VVALVKRGRPSSIPILIVVAFLLVGIIGSTFSAPAPRPTPTPDVISIGRSDPTAPPLPTPFGRYPAAAEATIVGSCVNGIDPKTVPPQIAQAFCVCTLNSFEQLYPTYDQFQAAIASGTITDELRTQISTRCTQALIGG
jgi:hypothetical protein